MEYATDDITRFKKIRSRFKGLSIFAHSGYLINLSGNDSIRNKSITASIDELERAQRLEIPYLIIHPGSYKSTDIDTGIKNVSESLNTILSISESDVMILLETTAGQGSSLGYCFDHLARIINNSQFNNRLGVCIDTCHVFSSGYDITTNCGYIKMKKEISQTIGIERIRCIHLNDSKRELGSRIDRHEHIGKGKIGLKGFRNILTDKDLMHIPLILETPKDDRKIMLYDNHLLADKMNLKTVKKIMRINSVIHCF